MRATARNRARRKWIVAHLSRVAAPLVGPMTGQRLRWIMILSLLWLGSVGAAVLSLHRTGPDSSWLDGVRAVVPITIAIPGAIFAYAFPKRLQLIKSYFEVVGVLRALLGELVSLLLVSPSGPADLRRIAFTTKLTALSGVAKHLRELGAAPPLLLAIDVVNFRCAVWLCGAPVQSGRGILAQSPTASRAEEAAWMKAMLTLSRGASSEGGSGKAILQMNSDAVEGINLCVQVLDRVTCP